MIFTDRTIIVQKGTSSINDTIVLYRGDREVQIRFSLNEGSPFKFGSGASPNIIEKTEAAYGQLVIKTPNDLPAIFSEIAPTNEGKIVFTITAEMIDEITEVGNYTFQIRLFDENKNSRATIPEVVNGIEIREPIATEDVTDTNEVGVATVGYAMTTAGTTEDTFDSQGNYNKTTWGTGDRITASKLNKIEAGIDGVNKKVVSGGTGGGEVDLSGYVTKETGNANQITFADGQTFQAKLDAGTLKGEKGEQGDRGTDGLTTSISLNGVTYTQENGVITLPNITSGGNIPSVTQVEPEALDMPKVFFYGNALPTTKDNVNLTMDYVSNTTKFSSYIKLKCQGTSSMSYAKKNFTVNMYSDEARATKLKKDFKGWGAQSKFCLKANWVDTTHTRNISGARIGYDMIKSRPDSTFKQQLLTAPRYGLVDGFPIKLYFNGEFYGIYTWNISKDGWMFNMNSSNPNHIVLCAERNTDGNSSLINSCQFRQLWDGVDGGDWSYEFGTPSDTVKNSLNRCIGFVMNATDQEFHDNISDYFDLYSLLDYYCFSYLTCHLDGLAKNMLMVTYDGVIWGASLYDMDSIYGVSWNGGSFVSPQYQCPEQYQEQFSRLWVRIEQCFGAELYARYLELRQGALSLSNIIKHVEEIYDVIPDRVFADEKAKWTSLPNVNTNTMTRFRNYMRDRAVYVDAQMREIGTPQSSVECTGISLDKNTLALGVVAGGTTDDSNKNYLENVAWELGTLNGDDTSYSITDSTSDYRCQLTNLPVGTYTLHHDTYTYKKIGLKNNGQPLIGTNARGNVETDDVTFNITNPNTTVDISVFPNGVTPSGVTLTRTDISNIQEYSLNYTTTGSPAWGSRVNPDYLVVEFAVGSKTNVDRTKLVNICIGDDIYHISHTTPTSSDIAIILNTLSNKCFSSEYANVIYVCIALPKSKYGNTLDEFKAYCSNNGITNIYINKDIQSIGETLSAQLTATVTPNNCTQPVVWSVNPTGIVRVNDGLVKAVANGEATITATCGSYSDTCSVTVSGMIEETDIYETAEYAITEPRTFNGTSDYIDTGIKLFDTAKTFTIFVDYASNTSAPNNQATIFHCIHEEPPYRGLCLMKVQNGDSYFIGGQVNTLHNYTSNMSSNGKYLISFVNGVINNIVTLNNSNELVHSATDMASANPYVQISENLLIGCFQDTSGTKGRYWSGTINKFGVWYKQLTEAEINQVFGKNGGESGQNANYLANASWQAGTLNMNNPTVSGSIDNGSTDDRYTSVQIPAGKYALRSANATWKKFRLSDSKGNVVSYSAGENNTYDIIIDTSISDDIFTLEVSYYKPNDTIEVPSLTTINETNIITLTLDGSLNYNIPDWPENPSGENGQVNAEYVLSGISKVPAYHKFENYTFNSNMNSISAKGLAKQYGIILWHNKVYLSFTLDMAETGVTNDVESITNYLSNNPLTFKYVM